MSNLLSEFCCYGLYLLCNEALKRLPERATQNLHFAESKNISLKTIIELLKENCGHSKEDEMKRGKKNSKKKIWFTKCNGWKDFGD